MLWWQHVFWLVVQGQDWMVAIVSAHQVTETLLEATVATLLLSVPQNQVLLALVLCELEFGVMAGVLHPGR